MQKTFLLALVALNVLAPKVWAQDDDAELGLVHAETPDSGSGAFADDSDPSYAAPAATAQQTPPPASTPAPAPSKPATTAQPAGAPASNPPTTEPPADASATNSTTTASAAEPGVMDGRRRPAQTFGILITRPDKIGKYNHYDYLYGKTHVSPGFYAGYYLYSYFVDYGIVSRISYYHDEGHPLAKRDGLTFPFKSNLTVQEKDKNQKLALTMIPVQISAEAAVAPFKTRWLVLRGWVGYEFLYVSESVSPDLPSSTSTSDAASTYTNSGWNKGLATGFMISFSMTGFDARSDKSLHSLGVDRSYFSVFTENVKTTQEKFGNFDRRNYGIAFSFEGLR